MRQPKLTILNRVGVDFDKTLCASYWNGTKWVMGKPLRGAENGLKAIKRVGKKPWVYTARPGAEEIEIWEWLERWGLKKYIHGVDTSKSLYFRVIDDRAGFKDWETQIKETELWKD